MRSGNAASNALALSCSTALISRPLGPSRVMSSKSENSAKATGYTSRNTEPDTDAGKHSGSGVSTLGHACNRRTLLKHFSRDTSAVEVFVMVPFNRVADARRNAVRIGILIMKQCLEMRAQSMLRLTSNISMMNSRSTLCDIAQRLRVRHILVAFRIRVVGNPYPADWTRYICRRSIWDNERTSLLLV